MSSCLAEFVLSVPNNEIRGLINWDPFLVHGLPTVNIVADFVSSYIHFPYKHARFFFTKHPHHSRFFFGPWSRNWPDGHPHQNGPGVQFSEGFPRRFHAPRSVPSLFTGLLVNVGGVFLPQGKPTVNSPLMRPYFLGAWHWGRTLRFPWRQPGTWKIGCFHDIWQISWRFHPSCFL